MHICGIVSEYNPFHKGHERHIRITREKTGADFIVCVMSGNFVQRGEPAIFDKWARAECAIRCGADAVIELPLLSSIQSAEGFAAGGVAVLNAAGADLLSFGTETGNLTQLEEIAQRLYCEDEQFKNSLKEHLSTGISYPEARMMAAFPGAPDETTMPNSILGIEYLKAIKRGCFDIKPYAIKREGEDYHSKVIEAPLASATAIRKAVFEEQAVKAFNAMPEHSAECLNRHIENGMLPVAQGAFYEELAFIIRREGIEYLRNLPDVSEGLEYRIYDAVSSSSSLGDAITSIKTKRYAYTRISRILLYALLGITKDRIQLHNASEIKYIRILSAKNKHVMSALAKSSRVPVIAGSVANSDYARTDITASDIYALSQNASPYRNTGRDFTEKLLLLS